MLSPMRNAMRIIHRVLFGSSETCSHFRMAQKVTAVKNDDMAYTSPSTALNQNDSVKV